MTYTAIDFETANRYAGGACSVGLAKFDGDGKLLDTYYTTIRPHSTYMDPYMSAVHGLCWNDVCCSPEFDGIYQNILDFAGYDLMIAHNAPFDFRVLRGCIELYDLKMLENPYVCTCQISRKVFPDLPDHKLPTLASYFSIDYNSHYALDDSIACGKIMKIACRDNLESEDRLFRYLKCIGVKVRSLTE